MIKIYSGLKGFTISLFFIAGIILLVSVFGWGITEAIELLLPLLTAVAYLLIIAFVLVILPASFFKDLRPSLGLYSLLMSHILGVAAWMVSFFFVVKAFGPMGLFLAFLFQFLAPVALVGSMLKGAWSFTIHLSLWLSFVYTMRFYSRWLATLNAPKSDKGPVIDIEATEVRGH